MSVASSLVKELRERTGAGMMECKKALDETAGDIDKAIELMRKSGQAKAAKKAGRIAAEGVIMLKISADHKQAVIIEINSETDFVARDTNFVGFAEKTAEAALAAACQDVTQLLNCVMPATQNETVEHARQQLVIKIGENINVRRLQMLKTAGIIGSYVHGGRIGVLVELRGGDTALARDVAMHVAASNPTAVSAEQVPAELVAKEKEIAEAQAQQSGKPANIIEKMVAGRVKKFLDEVTLLGQPFVKNPDQTVGALLKAANAEVVRFVRFEVGEGIEKQQEDFVAAVMAQVRGE